MFSIGQNKSEKNELFFIIATNLDAQRMWLFPLIIVINVS